MAKTCKSTSCMTLLYKWCMIVIVILVLYSNINVNHAQADSATDFITWDDMNVDLCQHHHHHHHHDFSDYNNHQYVMIRDQKKLERFDDKLNNYGQVDGISNNRVIVVDQKGGGDSVTVQGAIDMVPNFNSQRVKIYILPGIYREKVVIPASKPYISLIGEAKKTRETVITWGDKASDKTKDGSQLGTFNTASLDVRSDYFCASQITIENSALWEEGEGSQAVAFKLTGNKAVLYKVRFLGNQDTLLDQTGHHFFYKCFIEGNVDFVFGNAKSLYKECVLHSKATRYGAVAAHHRESLDEDTGFSFTNCTINGSGRIDLGRAWGKYSTTIYSFCYIGDMIHPPGWSDWGNPSKQKTAIFGEYQCRGEGADRRYRVPWSKSLDHNEATPFMDMKFIYGDQWLRL